MIQLKKQIFFVSDGVFFKSNSVFIVSKGVFIVSSSVFIVSEGVFIVSEGIFFKSDGVFFVSNGVFFVSDGVFFVSEGVFFVFYKVLGLFYNGLRRGNFDLSNKNDICTHIKPMRPQRTRARRTERKLRFLFSALISVMFTPNHTNTFKWWQIFIFLGVLALVFFILDIGL